MDEPVDISLMAYDEFLRFVFDHSIEMKLIEGKEKDWYWEFDYDTSIPSRLIENVTQLCNEFAGIVKVYTLPQIDQGIWFLIGPCLSFGQYLADVRVPIETRQLCLSAMYRVYADFVSKSDVEVMENCFQMWWDLLLGDFYGGREMDDDGRKVENKMLEILSLILQLDDRRTQGYALHGLGHLKHSKAREVVAQYIIAHGDEWDEEGREWLQSCRDGTVM